MELNKATYLLISYIVIVQFDENISNKLRNNSRYGNLFQLYMNKCFFVNKMKPLIVIANWSNCLFHNYYFHKHMSIINVGIENSDHPEMYLNKSKRYILDPTSVKFKPYPIEQIILLGFNLADLKLALYKLKESIWWNIHGFYFIDNSLSFYSNCEEAYLFLKLMWEFNILSVVFLCTEFDKRISLFTFNPYSSEAPKIWKKYGKYNQSNGHLYSLFKQSYSLYDLTKHWNKICLSLNFDKTKTLSGYPIKMYGNHVPVFNPYDKNRKGPFKFGGLMGKIVEIIWTKLNCSVTQDMVSDFGFISADGIPGKTFEDLFRGKYDVFENIFYETGIWQNQINLRSTSGICYVSRKENMSISIQVLRAFSFNVWITIIVFYTFMIIIFVYLLRERSYDAAMEVLRAIIGTSTLKQPEYMLKRLIFVCLVYIFMMFTAFLQSQLSSMHVTLAQYKYLETIEDIINRNYNVYAAEVYHQYYEVGVRKRIMSIDHFKNCFENMQIDNKVTCIDDCGEINFYTQESVEIHVSQDFYKQKYLVYLFRDDFPLIKRVANVFYSMYESGITKYLQNDVAESKILKSKISTQMIQEYKSISFEEMKLALYLLAIGFFCGGLTFMIETVLNIMKRIY